MKTKKFTTEEIKNKYACLYKHLKLSLHFKIKNKLDAKKQTEDFLIESIKMLTE